VGIEKRRAGPPQARAQPPVAGVVAAVEPQQTSNTNNDMLRSQSKVAHFAQERGREEQSEEGHFAHFSKHAF